MKILLYLIIVFNMIDVYCSIYLMGYGAIELNPIMSFLLQYPIVAIWVKLLVSILFSIIVWKMRKYKSSYIVTWVAFILYLILVIYYFNILIFIL